MFIFSSYCFDVERRLWTARLIRRLDAGKGRGTLSITASFCQQAAMRPRLGAVSIAKGARRYAIARCARTRRLRLEVVGTSGSRAAEE
jgi:hypothetical protein